MLTTRREFLAGSTMAIAGGLLAGPARLAAWQQAPSAVFTPIRGDAGFFTGRGGTIGYLINATGIAVVDSQFPESAEVCIEGVRERSGRPTIDRLINTHHHGDHTAGNVAFRGVAAHVVAHERAAEHMRMPPGRGAGPDDQLYPDVTFADQWREQIGGEWVRAKHYGRAHTGGDIVVTFEAANVAHMGDLMFNRRHPVIDRPAGAIIANWATVLEQAVADHDADTAYVFGHAGGGHPVTGARADLLYFRDYLTALLEFVQDRMTAGRSQTEIEAIRDPLPQFPDHGPLSASVLANAYGELSGQGDTLPLAATPHTRRI